MMRLGVKCTYPSSTLGSANVYAREVAKSILTMTPGSVLLSSNNWPDLPSTVPVFRLGLPLDPHTLLRRPWAPLSNTFSCATLAARARLEVIYCPFVHEAFPYLLSTPQVVTVHDVVPLIWPRDFRASNALWRLFYMRATAAAAAIITVSEASKEDIVKYCQVDEARVTVVHNGFTPPAQSYVASTAAEPYILYVSSSHYPYKNIRRLLEAYSLLRYRIPHRLCIVGRRAPRFRRALSESVHALSLSDRVDFEQDLPSEVLASRYQNAAAFVYPSLYEGFGIPPLEAIGRKFSAVLALRQPVSNFPFQTVHAVFRHTA